jgi:hypothetical protein
MSQALIEKIDHIETLLLKINAKIDNFLGFEELNEKERKEVEALRKDVKSGEYVGFDEVFGD